MAIGQLAGVLVVIIAVALLFIFVLLGRKKAAPALRRIHAVQQMQQAVGLAMEDGKRLHISLGSSSLLSPSNTSALAGLAALQRMSQLAAVSDRPPVATSGDAGLALLSQDTLQGTSRAGSFSTSQGIYQGRLSGVTPLSYAVGAIPVIRDEQAYTNFFIGNFGAEGAFLTDATWQTSSFSIAASDSLTGQAVFYALSQEPLIGEDLYALPAYVKAGPFHTASLQVQDVLRWLVILVLTGGVILKLIEVFLGIKLL
jgi:hypothetical protein